MHPSGLRSDVVVRIGLAIWSHRLRYPWSNADVHSGFSLKPLWNMMPQQAKLSVIFIRPRQRDRRLGAFLLLLLTFTFFLLLIDFLLLL